MKPIKIQECQPLGKYSGTEIDTRKHNADFRLIQVPPYYIKWKDGRTEKVNKRHLNKLQKEFTWEVDF